MRVKLFSLVAALAVLLIPIGTVGCKIKDPPARIAWKATGTVLDSAESAMEAWYAHVAIREAKIAELKKTDRGAAMEQASQLLRDEGKVLNALAAYQDAAKAAIAIGAASTPVEGQPASSQASAAVSAAATQLISLVSTLTSKP